MRKKPIRCHKKKQQAVMVISFVACGFWSLIRLVIIQLKCQSQIKVLTVFGFAHLAIWQTTTNFKLLLSINPSLMHCNTSGFITFSLAMLNMSLCMGIWCEIKVATKIPRTGETIYNLSELNWWKWMEFVWVNVFWFSFYVPLFLCIVN